MTVIGIPEEVKPEIIEQQIKEIFPQINDKFPKLSMLWMERILLFINEIRKGKHVNDYLIRKGKLDVIQGQWVQLSREKKRLIFPVDSPYSKVIWKEVLLKYVEVNMYDSNHEFYLTGAFCKHYDFINEVSTYSDYTLIQKKTLEVKKKLQLVGLKNDGLSKEQIEIRKRVIGYTGDIKLANNNEVIAIIDEWKHHEKRSSSDFLECFNNNDYGGRVDSYGFRLHNKVSGLKGLLLPYLNMDGEELVGIDIRNSQPYLLSMMNTQLLEKLNKDYFNRVIPIVEQYQDEADFKQFKELCVEGKIYDYIQDCFLNEYGKELFRGEVKELVFYVMFSESATHTDLKWKQRKELIELFYNEFPSVYSLIRDIQGIDLGLKRIKGNKNRYKNSSLLLQRIESSIVYDFLSPKLIKSDIKFSTIHDSILIKQSDHKRALEIFQETFVDLGLPVPVLKDK